MNDAFSPILTAAVGHPGSWTLDHYLSRGGYEGFRKALSMSPEQVVDEVRRAGLRGRGGAGFPTGQKWSFVPRDTARPKYLICNADESEPGSFKDRMLLENDPHQVLEGVAIAAYAIGSHRAFIYMRGEFSLGAERMTLAIEEATARGFLGSDALGSGYSLEVTLFRGAGAYICGEETALLESIEGKRPQPRYRPPFPAAEGLYGMPTVVNNVETLANVPHILRHGADWYLTIGNPPRNTGPKIFSLSGRVRRPGNYELPLGTTVGSLIFDHGAGIIGDRSVKAIIPGGTSASMLPGNLLDLPLDFDSVAQAGSMLGTGGVIVLDDTVCIPHAVLRMVEFYNHESCGKCTPCREGTFWLVKLLSRIVGGHATGRDLDLLEQICGNIVGRTLCALGDAACMPVISSLKLFRDEYEHHLATGQCLTVREAVR
jgi:NADH-quinone oxidoreductase subunit F